MSRIASFVVLAIAALVLAAPCSAEESAIKSDTKKVAQSGREIGQGIGAGAKKFGKAVAATAKKGAKVVKAGAQKAKRNLAEE